MNRETKRMMQRQGQVGPDGNPVATASRPNTPQQRLTSRPSNAPRRSIVQALKDVRAELRKVAWPTPDEVRRYSIVVLITLAVLIALIFLLDWAFSAASTEIFK